jgi:cyclophilin family peptidyl-prolyl cis-trans isomerase
MKSHTYKKEMLKTIETVYKDLPDEFYAHTLFRKVLKYFAFQGKYPYADTVMRYFRELRESDVIQCECVNRQKSLYVKKYYQE